MTLEELMKVRDSLRELYPAVEDFSWGPTLEFAKQRKQEALAIINRAIKEAKEKL